MPSRKIRLRALLLRHGRMMSEATRTLPMPEKYSRYLLSVYAHDPEHGKRTSLGEWTHEPDRHLFYRLGFQMLAQRGHMGSLCGYIRVTADHPWANYVRSDLDVRCHGGVTWCGGAPSLETQDGDQDTTTWIGFDCAHAGDVIPGMPSTRGMRMRWSSRARNQYRNLRWVMNECIDLAYQARKAASG